MRPILATLIKTSLRRTMGAVTGLALGPEKKFVIVGSGRSGSNLLVALLRSHPRVRIHSEIFGEYMLEDHAVRRWINRIGPVAYLHGSFGRMFAESAVGLKILNYQLGKGYGKSRGVPDVELARDALLSDPDLAFVHLKRRDKLARLISAAMAAKTTQWTGGEYKTEQVEIPVEFAERNLREAQQEESFYDEGLPDDRTLTLYYEDLVADRPTTMRKVLKFLDLSSVWRNPEMKKQNTRAPREVVSNLDELKTAFSDTEFAAVFAGK